MNRTEFEFRWNRFQKFIQIYKTNDRYVYFLTNQMFLLMDKCRDILTYEESILFRDKMKEQKDAIKEQGPREHTIHAYRFGIALRAFEMLQTIHRLENDAFYCGGILK